MAPVFPSRLRDPLRFPIFQFFLLAIIRLSEPIALTSIFPYAWKFVKVLKIGQEKDASFYAGLLISAFSLGEAFSGMFWGSLSDRIGRKPVLICGGAGTILSLLVVGLAHNFWIALMGRTIGGLLNGNIAVIQTMVGELVTNPKHETRAYAIMPFVWSVGTVLGPAIGGILADPTRSFPNTFSRDGVFGHYPYFLPNLVCAFLLLVSIMMGYFLLEETYPDKQPSDRIYLSEQVPMVVESDIRKISMTGSNLTDYGTVASSCGPLNQDKFSECSTNKTLNPRILGFIYALGIFTYHSMTYDHLFPIFLEDNPKNITFQTANAVRNNSSSSGLGLSTGKVGLIMSIDGLLAIIVQVFIFPFAAEYLGIKMILLVVTSLHPVSFLIVPYLSYLSASWLDSGIYACLTIRNILSIIAYPALLISIKEATPSLKTLGKVNGLAASIGAASRTIAPPISGYLYGLETRTNLTGLAWYMSALVAGLGAVQIFTIQKEKKLAKDDPTNNLEIEA
ncbi:BgTH12-00294 [Blumeria graminis f. sp. triticale]|uniref:BgtA-20894 n=3 Tax=Blumeria graminis TaxID=34373 RepID=A0A9X9MMP5_BLUGR|nr:hypothetical protein BGT96224_A20894 [Blumeria graminis f. sp. tritici 96224]CAD6504791.1 BgTH12-00294 [Blumeria graminis f. sp. triticale]VDB92815.1 BgtA-20894 [Blumeria graminis f. sp. tritici]